MKYIVVNEDLLRIIFQLDTELSKVEVKGDSVNSLWIGRTLIKKIFEDENQKSFEEILEIEKSKKEKEL